MEVALHLARVRRNLAPVLALLVAAVVLGVLASTYLGTSSSPYGMCEGTNGQQVACATLEAVQP